MAYWNIRFTSDEGTNCEVRLFGFSQSKELIAAEDPFTTSCDNTEDIFTPIRGGSGYIRCIGKVGEVDELFVDNSSKHHVQFLQDGKVVWIGACKAEAYSQPYTPGYINIEIPVVDTVSMLDGEYWPTSSVYPISLEDLFFEFTELIDAGVESFHFPHRTHPSEIRNHHVNPLNWIKTLDEKDISGNIYEVATLREIMEDVCKVYGWSLRQHGCDWYFTNMDIEDANLRSDTYYKVDREDWRTQITEKVTYFNPVGISGTKHSISLYQGKRSITVEGNPGQVETDLFDVDFDELGIVGEAQNTKQVGRSVVSLLTFGFTGNDTLKTTLYGPVRNMPLTNMFSKYIAGTDQYNTGITGIGLEAYDYFTEKLDSREEVKTPQYTEAMILCPGPNAIDGAVISPQQIISTTHEDTYVFFDGHLEKIPAWSDEKVDVDTHVIMAKIKFGNLYLQEGGLTWSTVERYVGIYFRDGKPVRVANRHFYIRGNRELGTGACILLPTGVTGKLEITMRAPIKSENDPYVALSLSDFKLSVKKIVKKYSEHADGKPNIAKAFIGKGNTEDYSVEMNLTCQRGDQTGPGIIMGAADIDSYGRKFYPYLHSIDKTFEAPESFLLKRLEAYYRTSTRVLDIGYKKVQPTPINTVLVFDRDYAVASVECDWRRESFKCRLIEI